MELRHLRYFVAVAEEGTFVRAAERLHLAQPALSRQIRDLEREVGVELLERGPRAVRLAPAGEAALRRRRSNASGMRFVPETRTLASVGARLPPIPSCRSGGSAPSGSMRRCSRRPTRWHRGGASVFGISPMTC